MFTFKNSKISGIAGCVPNNIIKNNLSSKELKFVGVVSKFYDKKGTIKTSDLCLTAASNLIKKLNWKKEEINYIIFVSQTRNFIFPSTACILQNELNLNKDILAFDIPLGCSGFIYGLINSFLLSEKFKGKGLLLLGDMSNKFVDIKDKQNQILFGDAGAAVGVDYSKSKTKSYFSFGTDGSGSEYIKYDSNQFNNKFKGKFIMKGGNVFQYMSKKIPLEVIELMQKSKVEMHQIDYFVPHQASKFLIETISKKLNIKNEKVLLSLRNFGNTNSASIPITLLNEKKKVINTKLLLSGFGVGLSWGNCILDLHDVKFTKILKL